MEQQELEEQLVEAGRKLLDPHSITELLLLLDHIESCLSRVEQSPSKSMYAALEPSMNALVRDELLRHSDPDVRVAVASCISEITRITAPDAPYDDGVMKDIFQMTVAAFEKLHDIGSPSFSKRVSILETVAKVRSCVVMLDLECDDLILEMFHHFINAIREDHSAAIFSAMETIMTLVLSESEEISSDISSFLLFHLRNDNQDVLPIARRLVETVSGNCAAKLKTCMVEMIRSMDSSFNDYSEIITSICHDTSGNLEHNDVNASSPNLADERKVSGCGQPVEPPQVAEKPVCETDAQGEVDTTLVKSPKSRMSNGTTKSGKENTMADPQSPKKKPERSRRNTQSKITVAVSKAEPDSLDPQKNAVPEATPDNSNKRTRVRKSDSFTHSTEISDHSREKEITEPSSRKRGRSKESENSAPPGEETEFPSELEKTDLSSPVESNIEGGSVASPAPNQSPPNTGRPKRGGQSGRKLSVKRGDKKQEGDLSVSPQDPKGTLLGDDDKVLPSADAISTKESEINTITEGKQGKGSGEKGDAGNSYETEPPVEEHQKEKRSGRKRKDVAEKGVSGELSTNKIIPPTSPEKTSIKDQKHSEGTPRTAPKRKNVSGKKEAPGSGLDDDEVGENLVGSNIKVWWPVDKKFYDGIVESFDPVRNKHRIIYTDGDEEMLFLKKEKWELIGAGTMPDKGTKADLSSPDVSTEKPAKKKARTSSDSTVKQMKLETPLKKEGGSSSKSKGEASKTGIKLEAETPKTGSKTKSDISKANGKKSGGKVKSYTSKTTVNSKSDNPKDEVHDTKVGKKSKSTPITPKTGSKPKSETLETDSQPEQGTPKTRGRPKPDTGNTGGKSKGIPKTDSKPKADTPKSSDKSKPENAEIDNESKTETPKTGSKSKVATSKSSGKSNSAGSSGNGRPGTEKARESKSKSGKKRQRGARS